jgi:hypothetical protein
VRSSSQQWLTHKGGKTTTRSPDVRFTTNSEPWELAAEFRHLMEEILELDIEFSASRATRPRVSPAVYP